MLPVLHHPIRARCVHKQYTHKAYHTHTHPKTQSATEKGTKTKSQITQDPSSKKTLVPDSHVSSVSALCQTKALNESGWESQDPTALTCSQSSYLTQRQAFLRTEHHFPKLQRHSQPPSTTLRHKSESAKARQPRSHYKNALSFNPINKWIRL